VITLVEAGRLAVFTVTDYVQFSIMRNKESPRPHMSALGCSKSKISTPPSPNYQDETCTNFASTPGNASCTNDSNACEAAIDLSWGESSEKPYGSEFWFSSWKSGEYESRITTRQSLVMVFNKDVSFSCLKKSK